MPLVELPAPPEPVPAEVLLAVLVEEPPFAMLIADEPVTDVEAPECEVIPELIPPVDESTEPPPRPPDTVAEFAPRVFPSLVEERQPLTPSTAMKLRQLELRIVSPSQTYRAAEARRGFHRLVANAIDAISVQTLR
jgi:hypothetical protein